jgi:hypothetical protein
MRITRRIAKAIVKSPRFGELATDGGTIVWILKTIYTWPSCQPQMKIDIYFNDKPVGRCDLNWLRECAAG